MPSTYSCKPLIRIKASGRLHFFPPRGKQHDIQIGVKTSLNHQPASNCAAFTLYSFPHLAYFIFLRIRIQNEQSMPNSSLACIDAAAVTTIASRVNLGGSWPLAPHPCVGTLRSWASLSLENFGKKVLGLFLRPSHNIKRLLLETHPWLFTTPFPPPPTWHLNNSCLKNLIGICSSSPCLDYLCIKLISLVEFWFLWEQLG